MKHNTLKTIRIITALVVFLPILLFFCDFTGKLPKSIHAVLHFQLVPAVLHGVIAVILFQLLLVLVFGRIYCSVFCPLGVLQDIIARFTGRGKKKNKKKRWYNYTKPYPILRYSLLVICIGFLLFGRITPLLVLDPYSNFGRIAVNLFRPAVMEVNNLVNWIALKFNNYDFYHVTIYTITVSSLIFSAIALLAVGIMSFLRGRLFCNTICPVGSFLGLLSRFSLFRIVLDDTHCTSCGLCEKACKSQCISSKEKKVDASRCVACFNCTDRCKQKGIRYRFAYKRLPEKELLMANNVSAPSTGTINEKSDKTLGMNRRSFIMTSTAMAATVPLVPAWAQTKEADETKSAPITPPGSRSLAHFKKHCTACHLCVTHCPQQILKPAGFNFGITYAFKPHAVYSPEHYCNYECTVCSEVCPNGAIERLTVDEKKVTQIGIAHFAKSLCVVFTDNTSCGACSEHCPVQAVRMEDYKDGLTIPHVYEDLCIGCGACESICPVRPLKAINIKALAVHKTAVEPQEDENKTEFNNEFGF